MGARTVAADVADELARRVAAGEYAPGDLMPSVRRVAEEFGMNRATAQLILGRLESHGFVRARRGKGFTIRDVRAEGGVEVYRRLFRLSIPVPEVAVEMFRDIVAMQRRIVADALLAYTTAPRGVERAELRADIDALESLARQPHPDHARVLAGELALVRKLLTGLGDGMRRAVLNSVGELVFEVPEAVAAYDAAGPELRVLVWRALAAVWDSGAGPSPAQLALFDDLFGGYHDRVVARFAELLSPVGGTAGSGVEPTV
ncbi:winged helix-turn-helix domain-containing protein [Nocardia terpenica]|uniref:GntR family transcriptional regulator n=1 Tax=Nocardia terpenica TaxID=455432 RepID=A0A291RLR5_9NOCA|nr:winged helix-turn-helix domain-containing protein [Nocardia terpenica]ATL68255.1 GntR family transcriptional regulator [Nocardia terpenica]